MTDLPDATREMVQFVAEQNSKNNENSMKRDKIVKIIKKKRDEVAEAIIGTGNALKSLTEQKTEFEEKLVIAEKDLAYIEVSGLFAKKFGINMYSVNLNPKLSQKEVDAISSKEED